MLMPVQSKREKDQSFICFRVWSKRNHIRKNFFSGFFVRLTIGVLTSALPTPKFCHYSKQGSHLAQIVPVPTQCHKKVLRRIWIFSCTRKFCFNVPLFQQVDTHLVFSTLAHTLLPTPPSFIYKIDSPHHWYLRRIYATFKWASARCTLTPGQCFLSKVNSKVQTLRSWTKAIAYSWIVRRMSMLHQFRAFLMGYLIHVNILEICNFISGIDVGTLQITVNHLVAIVMWSGR